MMPPSLVQAERLTLAVLLSGVAALAFSDFVSPFYWAVVVVAAALRLWRGAGFALTEMQASLVGWFGFFWVGVELFFGRAFLVAFTDFLLILALAVAVEEPTPRNHVHRLLVGLFLILAAAVLTDSVLYALPLIGFLIFAWRAAQRLYGIAQPGGDLPLSAWRSDMMIMLLTVGLTAMLFISLPRFDFHGYLKPVQPRMATSGFSNRVNLGDFARRLDTTVVMRIEPVDGDVSAFRRHMLGRYWRGVVLDRFTGIGWRRSLERTKGQWQPAQAVRLGGGESGSGMRVAVYREASDHGYVFIPDGMRVVTEAPAAMHINETGALSFRRPPSRRLRLIIIIGGQEESHLILRPPRREETDVNTVPAAVREWAAKVTAGVDGADAKLAHLMGELKSWTYDLDADIDPAHPVESFVRKGRRGHCELFASAMALAARSLGVPARVVNGYYGGEWNAVGGFYLIRQQHAHSWVEVWRNGRWQRLDPTPASRWALSGVRFPAFDQLWESVRLSWYRYVLEFENADRGRLVSRLTAWLKHYFPWLLVAMLAVAAAWMLAARAWRSVRRCQPASGFWPVLDRWLARRGMRRALHQPLRMLPRPSGVAVKDWEKFVCGWEEQVYDDRQEHWSRHVLRRHLRALSAARW